MITLNSSKKWILLIVLAAAALATVFLVIKPFIDKSKSAQTLILSNGKEVYIGETVKEATTKLGADFHYDAPGEYHYPGIVDIKHPLQVFFYVHNDNIVGMRIRNNPGNIQKVTGIHLGMNLDEVKVKIGNNARPLDMQLIRGRVKGYVLQNSKSVSRFYVNPCTSDKKIIVFELMDLSYKDAYGNGVGCGNRY